MLTMPSSPSSTRDRQQQFKQALEQNGPKVLWEQVLSAVAQAIESNYQRVKLEMEADGADAGDPDNLLHMLSNLEPARVLNQLHERNPQLNLARPETEPLQITLELVSLLGETT